MFVENVSLLPFSDYYLCVPRQLHNLCTLLKVDKTRITIFDLLYRSVFH